MFVSPPNSRAETLTPHLMGLGAPFLHARTAERPGEHTVGRRWAHAGEQAFATHQIRQHLIFYFSLQNCGKCVCHLRGPVYGVLLQQPKLTNTAKSTSQRHFSHQTSANQDHNEKPLHTHRAGCNLKKKIR